MNVQLTILKDSFLIEKFNKRTGKFLILAEHSNRESAERDLKMWMAS